MIASAVCQPMSSGARPPSVAESRVGRRSSRTRDHDEFVAVPRVKQQQRDRELREKNLRRRPPKRQRESRRNQVRINSPLTMRPRWRRLARACLLATALASLVALFGQQPACLAPLGVCHALTLNQTTTNQTTTTTTTTTTLAPSLAPTAGQSATLLAPGSSVGQRTTTPASLVSGKSSSFSPAPSQQRAPSTPSPPTGSPISSNSSAANKLGAALRSQLKFQQASLAQSIGERDKDEDDDSGRRTPFGYLQDGGSNNGRSTTTQQQQLRPRQPERKPDLPLHDNYHLAAASRANNGWLPAQQAARSQPSAASQVRPASSSSSPADSVSSITGGSPVAPIARGPTGERAAGELSKQVPTVARAPSIAGADNSNEENDDSDDDDGEIEHRHTDQRRIPPAKLGKVPLTSSWAPVETNELTGSGPANVSRPNSEPLGDMRPPFALDPRRVDEASRRQLVPHTLLLHSLLRDALSELASAQSHENGAILSSALAAATSNRGTHQQPQHQAQNGFGQLWVDSSQSAPSVSLPPLSHLLAPRNPFRLFSSSSAPIVSRYLAPPSSRPQPSQSQASQQQRPFQPEEMLASVLSSSKLLSANAVAAAAAAAAEGRAPRVYAHAHSAEQLEKLIRAASRQAGGRAPTILPAIVSAPNGPMPGLYIPALEPAAEASSESQASELRLGGGDPHAAASTSSLGRPAAGAQFVSRIPGTDYLLHPDEVRAMINMGELAWRNQQQQQQHQSQQQQVASASSWQMAAATTSQQQRPPTMGPFAQAQAANLMEENHAQNARDFAYVEPQMRRDQPTGRQPAVLSSASSSIDEQQLGGLTWRQRINASELEGQLIDHFRQASLSSFPAVIRVNNQDYIHWPLVRLNDDRRLAPDETRSASQQQPIAFPGLGQHGTAGATWRQHNIGGGGDRRQPFFQVNDNFLAQQETRQREPNIKPNLDPVRLATQLTPVEIRQVEDSILEALIMAQSLRNQQRLAAAASRRRPAMVLPGQPQHLHQQHSHGHHKKGEQQRAARFGAGLFGRRRRRNLANSNNKTTKNTNKSASAMIRPSESFSEPQFAPLPWSNYSLSPAVHPFQLAEPLLPLASEPLLLESKNLAHLRPLLADQATNRQPNLLLAANSDAVEIFEAASEPKVSSVLLNPAERIQMAMLAHHSRQQNHHHHQQQQEQQHSALDEAASTFGARVLPLATMARPSQLEVGPKGGRQSEFSSVASYGISESQRRPPAAGSSGGSPSSARINVDWPGMVSDADYFPGSEAARGSQSELGNSGSPRLSASGSRNHADRLVFRSPHNPAQISASWRPLQEPPAGSGSGSSRRQAVGSRLVATSQLKLQFAPDYQAREGVPIYNNNVRAAGASGSQQRAASSAPMMGANSMRDTDDHSYEPLGDEDSEESATVAQRHLARAETIRDRKSPQIHSAIRMGPSNSS